MSAMENTNKATVRKAMLDVRDAISRENHLKWSSDIGEQIRKSGWWKDSEVLLSYASFRSEVETDELNRRALAEKKILCLPRTFPKERRMEFYRVDSLEQLGSGYQGIREPMGDKLRPIGREDLCEAAVMMLMPGVAFDENHNRIGYGGGYYDRYLERYGKYIDTTVMLAYACQRIHGIPAGELDVSPDYVVINKEE